jgi:hypothetical protein
MGLFIDELDCSLIVLIDSRGTLLLLVDILHELEKTLRALT